MNKLIRNLKVLVPKVQDLVDNNSFTELYNNVQYRMYVKDHGKETHKKLYFALQDALRGITTYDADTYICALANLVPNDWYDSYDIPDYVGAAYLYVCCKGVKSNITQQMLSSLYDYVELEDDVLDKYSELFFWEGLDRLYHETGVCSLQAFAEEMKYNSKRAKDHSIETDIELFYELQDKYEGDSFIDSVIDLALSIPARLSRKLHVSTVVQAAYIMYKCEVCSTRLSAELLSKVYPERNGDFSGIDIELFANFLQTCRELEVSPVEFFFSYEMDTPMDDIRDSVCAYIQKKYTNIYEGYTVCLKQVPADIVKAYKEEGVLVVLHEWIKKVNISDTVKSVSKLIPGGVELSDRESLLLAVAMQEGLLDESGITTILKKVGDYSGL